jgi:hypothetical protein
MGRRKEKQMNGFTRIMRSGRIGGTPHIRQLTSCLVISVALAALASPRAIRADVVTDWNQITLNTQALPVIPGGTRTPPAARALAMVHLAIFDAVNAIDRRFTPYLVESLADPDASPEAAAVAAAHAVLVALYQAAKQTAAARQASTRPMTIRSPRSRRTTTPR